MPRMRGDNRGLFPRRRLSEAGGTVEQREKGGIHPENLIPGGKGGTGRRDPGWTGLQDEHAAAPSGWVFSGGRHTGSCGKAGVRQHQPGGLRASGHGAMILIGCPFHTLVPGTQCFRLSKHPGAHHEGLPS